MMGDRIHVVQGDITTFEGDAIVNAANPELAPGGGVCGAIFRAAGREALEAEILARYPRGCPTGDAVITGGHGLPARYIIHAVGPVWQGGGRGEAELLASAYRRSLEVAREAGCETVAFPAISTGIYGFPAEPAAEIAVRTVADFLASAPRMSVTLYAFDHRAFDLLRRVVAKEAD